MASNGRDEGAIRDAMDRLVVAQPSARQPLVRLRSESLLATYRGDLSAARDFVTRLKQALGSSPASRDWNWQYLAALTEAELALEVHDPAAARSAARDFEAHADNLLRNALGYPVGSEDLSLRLALLAFSEEGERGKLEAARHAWIEERRSEGSQPSLIWTYAWAATAFTRDEAVRALEELPKYLPLSMLNVTRMRALNPDADIGRTYFLAGKIDEAIPYLRRASASCTVWQDPFGVLRSSLLLGRALEQRDKQGACDAYRKVLERWGNAKPRSVTADEARARSRELGCGP
jgi:tetratricopeptide (TPR) repeat protein